ncbi:Hypothetical protein A7982_08306 [Minicystis rosea]|nr:Hypothetical protein A7982_08306 [Minicystis rosea]
MPQVGPLPPVPLELETGEPEDEETVVIVPVVPPPVPPLPPVLLLVLLPHATNAATEPTAAAHAKIFMFILQPYFFG